MNRETESLLGLLQSPDVANVALARATYLYQDVDRPFFDRIFAFIDEEFKKDEEGRILNWGKVDMRARGLTELPDELQYIYLTRLYCGGNQLTTLPEYPNLIELYCGENQLTTLPEYPNLIELYCYDNQLTTLGEYPKLTILYCWDNQLTTLGEYPKLTHLYCGGNQLTEETEERFKKRGLL
jgi:hypothetical protein